MGAERVSRESRVGYYLSSRAAQVSGWWWWWGWWWFGNHITPINHTFAKNNFSKTFWLISFKYYPRADNDKVRSRQWSVISLALGFDSKRLMQWSRSLLVTHSSTCHWHDLSWKGVDLWRGRSTAIAWHSSAHPLIHQRERERGDSENGTNIWRRRWQRFIVFPAAKLVGKRRKERGKERQKRNSRVKEL